MILNLIKENSMSKVCARIRGLCENLGCRNCYPRTLHKWLSDNNCLDKYIDSIDCKLITAKSNQKCKFKCRTCNLDVIKNVCDYTASKYCGECNPRRKLTTETFIIKACIVHGDKYNYDLVVYVKSDLKVKIICNTCGSHFMQAPDSHIQGHGCSKCGIALNGESQRSTKEKFASKSDSIHKGKYNYDKVIYVNDRTPVIIICKQCGDEFSQIPNSHLRGSGCIKCAIKKRADMERFTNDEFIEKAVNIHGNNYNYDNAKYIGFHIKVEIKCNSCNNTFIQSPAKHLHAKQGCPYCIFKTQAKIHNYLKAILPDYEIIMDKAHPHLGRRRPDFLIPALNLSIEYNGEQHYRQISNWESHKKRQLIDIWKYKKLAELGISTIIVPPNIKSEDEITPYIKKYDTPQLIYVNHEDPIHNDHRSIEHYDIQTLESNIEKYKSNFYNVASLFPDARLVPEHNCIWVDKDYIILINPTPEFQQLIINKGIDPIILDNDFFQQENWEEYLLQ